MIKNIADKLAQASSRSQDKKENDPVVSELKQKLRSLSEKEKRLSDADDAQLLKETIEKSTGGAMQNKQRPDGVKVEVEDAIKGAEPPLDTETFFDKKQSIMRETPQVLLEDQKITNLMMNQIKELITLNNNLNRQIADMDSRVQKSERDLENLKTKIDKYDDRMMNIDTRLEKFLGLYEIVTNQFNPFVEQDQQIHPVAPASIKSSTNSFDDAIDVNKKIVKELNPEKKKNEIPVPPTVVPTARPETKGNDNFYEKLIDTISEHIQHSLKEFETRMHEGIANKIDESVQKKLHSTLEFLDDALEEEISHMIHRETKKIQEDHTKITKLLGSIEKALPAESHPAHEEFDELKSAVSGIEKDITKIKQAEQSDDKFINLRDEILNKKADDNKHFVFTDGL